MASAVYLADNGRFFKIGTSANPQRRVLAISLTAGEEITLAACFLGGRQEERQLHKKFAHLRHLGEWFQRDPSISDEFSRLAAANPYSFPPQRYRSSSGMPLPELPPPPTTSNDISEVKWFWPGSGVSPREESALNKEWWVATTDDLFVSNLGRVVGSSPLEVITPVAEGGYWYFYLPRLGKVAMHRLVLSSFEGGPGGKVHCSRGLDIRLCNLYRERGTESVDRLSPETLAELGGRLLIGERQIDIARTMGLSPAVVSFHARKLALAEQDPALELKVLELLPKMTQRDLAKRLSIPVALVRHYAAKLRKAG